MQRIRPKAYRASTRNDWTIVDRTFDYYKKLGVMPYISIDSTPEILGGKTPPFGEDKLKNPEAKSGWSGFTPEVPNDMAAFGQLVRDLVHHVVKERDDNVPYWGVERAGRRQLLL